MKQEKYCALLLNLQEGEEVLAVGEEVALKLNLHYQRDRLQGKSASLPDLLSVKHANGTTCYRLREVKFKLQKDIVEKAISQLRSGARYLKRAFPSPAIDRLEIIVPLESRKLKDAEREFLGKPVAGSRYRLRLNHENISLTVLGKRLPVTVMIA